MNAALAADSPKVWSRANSMKVQEAVTRDILSHIADFLTFNDFPATVAQLHREREGKAAAPSVSSSIGHPLLGKEQRTRLKGDLLRYYDEGKRDMFFAAFHQYVPASALSFDLNAQKLEFNLNLYFAIYPVLPSSSVLVAMPLSSRSPSFNIASPGGPGPGSAANSRAGSPGLGGLGGLGGNRPELASRMKCLKTFLETRGAWLAHTGEFLAYYALPFVSHPEHHPSFEGLFQQDWISSQRRTLREYLDAVPAVTEVPRLYEMYDVFHFTTDEEPRLSPGTLDAQLPRHASRPASHSREAWAVRQSGPDTRRASLTGSASGNGLLHGGAGGASGAGGRGRIESALSASLQQQQGAGLQASRIPRAGAGGGSPRGGADGEGRPPRPGQLQSQSSLGRSRIPGAPAPKGPGHGLSPLRCVSSAADAGQHGEQGVTASAAAGKGVAPAPPAAAPFALTGEELDVLDEVLRSTVNLPPDAAALMSEVAAAAEADAEAAQRNGSSLSLVPGVDGEEQGEEGEDLGVEGGDGAADLEQAVMGALPAPLDAAQLTRAVVKGAQEGGAAAHLAARLLQALRWRLLSCSAGLDRCAVLANWVEQDLLGCSRAAAEGGASLLQTISHSPDLLLLEEAARLVNAVSSDHQGRLYLLQAPDTIPTLVALMNKGSDPAFTQPGSPAKPPLRRCHTQPRAADGSGDPTAVAGGGSAAGLAGEQVQRMASSLQALPRAPVTLRERRLSNAASAASAEGRQQLHPQAAGGGPGAGGEGGGEEWARDGVLVQQGLVALQKLSLRRCGQSQMLREGLLQWLVAFLQDPGLSEFTVEYGCALLMNLSLRSAGRAASQQDGTRTQLLQLAECLIESKNEQVRTYVCGTLYSVLQRPEVLGEARQRNLEGLLRAVAANSGSEISAHQIQYIVEQLESDVAVAHAGAGGAAGGGDDASDDGEEEADDGMNDAEAFADVELAVENLQPEPGVLQGEPLLCSAYLADTSEARAQASLVRSSLALATFSVRASTAAAVATAGRSAAAATGAEEAPLSQSVVFELPGGQGPGAGVGGGGGERRSAAVSSAVYSSWGQLRGSAVSAPRLDESRVLTGSIDYASVARGAAAAAEADADADADAALGSSAVRGAGAPPGASLASSRGGARRGSAAVGGSAALSASAASLFTTATTPSLLNSALNSVRASHSIAAAGRDSIPPPTALQAETSSVWGSQAAPPPAAAAAGGGGGGVLPPEDASKSIDLRGQGQPEPLGGCGAAGGRVFRPCGPQPGARGHAAAQAAAVTPTQAHGPLRGRGSHVAPGAPLIKPLTPSHRSIPSSGAFFPIVTLSRQSLFHAGRGALHAAPRTHCFGSCC